MLVIEAEHVVFGEPVAEEESYVWWRGSDTEEESCTADKESYAKADFFAGEESFNNAAGGPIVQESEEAATRTSSVPAYAEWQQHAAEEGKLDSGCPRGGGCKPRVASGFADTFCRLPASERP